MATGTQLGRALASTTYSFLAVFGVVGNVLVVFVILRSRPLRTRLNLFIVNIAVSDLIMALLYIPVSAVSVAIPGGLRDHAICPVVGTIGLVCAYESVFSAVLIAVSRCVRITRRCRYDELFSRRRCVVLVIASWVLSVLITTPMLAGFGKLGFNPITSTCDFDAVASFVYLVSLSLPAIATCNVIIIVSYVLIYRKVKSSSRRVRGNADDEKIPPAVLSQIKNMVAIYVGFNICICPGVVMNMIAYKTGDNLRGLNLVAVVVFACIPIVNPIIYTARNSEFRNQLKTLCNDVFKGRAQSDHEEGIGMKTVRRSSPADPASIANMQESQP